MRAIQTPKVLAILAILVTSSLSEVVPIQTGIHPNAEDGPKAKHDIEETATTSRSSSREEKTAEAAERNDAGAPSIREENSEKTNPKTRPPIVKVAVLHTLPSAADNPSSESGNTPSREEEEKMPIVERELTEDEKLAQLLYENATAILNTTKPEKKRAYALLREAASKGHKRSKELVAHALLTGDTLVQNVETAREYFYALAAEGSPFAQMHLGFMHAIGLGTIFYLSR